MLKSLCGAALILLVGCSGDDDPGAGGSGGGSAGQDAGGSGGSSASGGGGATSGGGSGGSSASGGSGGAGATSSGGVGGSGGAPSDGGGDAAPLPMQTFVYVGRNDSGGKVDVFSLDRSTGELTAIETKNNGQDAGFLTLHPDRDVLYAGDASGKKVFAYDLDPKTGKLSGKGSLDLSGRPVYLSADATGAVLLAAFYGEGQADVVSLNASGGLGMITDTVSPGEKAHAIVIDRSNQFVFVPNNGANTISQYVLDTAQGKLTDNTPASVKTTDGPRHLAFHPSADFAYVMNEQGDSMTAYAFDSIKGTLSELETEAALPPNAAANTTTGADLHVHPNGKFVYGSLRAGQNSSIVIFEIDAQGMLSRVGFENTRGERPRNFCLTEDGSMLLVANQDSSNVVAFKVDAQTGKLSYLTEKQLKGGLFFVGAYDYPL